MSHRLNSALLAGLPAQVRRPTYQPGEHGVGIVHLGLGAFHRAHQAVYIDDVLATTGGDWRILGVSCRSPLPRDQLRPQGYLYSVLERDGSGDRRRVIGSLADALVAPEDPAAVVTAMARSSTHIISLTITEKGYCRNAADGDLDLRHPDILHDLAHPEQPRSGPGLLLAALKRRRREGTPAPTLLSCDNLPHNGATLRAVVLRLAAQGEPNLAEWIDRQVAFPSTMVDRIVPATTPEDIAATVDSLGFRDEALVTTEPFRQWVIEDRFAGPRPALERNGAQLVSDVRPYEIAKLRLLNGSHSAMAYLGLLARYTFVHEAGADPHFSALVRHLMAAELAPTLEPITGLDIGAYQSALLARFANPTLHHRLSQIAMDGSQKLPQRLLEPLLINLHQGRAVTVIVLVLAAWMHYCVGEHHPPQACGVDDPLAHKYRDIARVANGQPAEIVSRFLQLHEVFKAELAAHEPLRLALNERLGQLQREGAQATAHRLVQELKL